ATISAQALAEIATRDLVQRSPTGDNSSDDDGKKKKPIENSGGRFLKRTVSGNNWQEVSTADAMEKISHALRGHARQGSLNLNLHQRNRNGKRCSSFDLSNNKRHMAMPMNGTAPMSKEHLVLALKAHQQQQQALQMQVQMFVQQQTAQQQAAQQEARAQKEAQKNEAAKKMNGNTPRNAPILTPDVAQQLIERGIQEGRAQQAHLQQQHHRHQKKQARAQEIQQQALAQEMQFQQMLLQRRQQQSSELPLQGLMLPSSLPTAAPRAAALPTFSPTGTTLSSTKTPEWLANATLGISSTVDLGANIGKRGEELLNMSPQSHQGFDSDDDSDGDEGKISLF
ncbi:MAG: hypothetical protein SGILL_009625, partial [Bacillariaceae sp.]